MKPLAFAIILVATMINGQEAKPHSDADRRNSAATSADATPHTAGQTVVVVNQQPSQGQENNHSSKPPSYLHELLLPQNLPNLALVIVAAITAGFVCWQARETAKATKAMVGNTAAFIESQRPILAIKPSGNPFADLMDRDNPRVQLALMNRGQTTAYECIYESWIELLPVPHPVMDFTPNADHRSIAERFSLPPNHEPLIINIPFTHGLSDADRADVGNARRTAYVRLRVTFRDAFTPSRYADFGYWVMYRGLGILPKYHDSN
ncbi:MAG: hypothetical protein WB799_18535 [Candidatus Sulfotelmatobacter sp.]